MPNEESTTPVRTLLAEPARPASSSTCWLTRRPSWGMEKGEVGEVGASIGPWASGMGLRSAVL